MGAEGRNAMNYSVLLMRRDSFAPGCIEPIDISDRRVGVADILCTEGFFVFLLEETTEEKEYAIITIPMSRLTPGSIFEPLLSSDEEREGWRVKSFQGEGSQIVFLLEHTAPTG